MSAIIRRAVYAALVCLIAAPVVAQEDAPMPAERRLALLEGTHAFRRILFDHDCLPLEKFKELSEDPSRSILIILGDLNRLNEVPGGVEEFVKNGGAVLLASDRPVRDRAARKAFLAVSGVSINSDATVVTYGRDVNHRDTNYRGIPYCPLLVPTRASPSLFVENNTPLRVATNVPSHLRHVERFPGSVDLLAVLPSNALYDLGNNRLEHPRISPLPFLVGGEVGKGRVLVAADHSLFINEMLYPEDIGNFEFTVNCVRWLQGDAPRNKVLFVDEKGIQTTFEIPLKSAQIPFDEMMELAWQRRNQLLKLGERELVRLERNNTFNAVAGRILDRADNPPGRLFAWVSLLLTLALGIYMVYRLGIRERFAHDTRTPLLAHAVSRNLPAGPLVEQRTRTLLRTGILNEPASRLVRRWLIAQGMTIPDESAPGEPPVKVTGGWWHRRKMLNRLRRVWQLASGRAREKIGPSDLWRVQRELEALTAARQRGEWLLSTDEGQRT